MKTKMAEKLKRTAEIIIVVILLVFTASISYGEDDGTAASSDTAQASAFSPDAALFQIIVMTKEGTGTGWQPEFSPMHGFGFRMNSWNMMLHYNWFIRYLDTDVKDKGVMGARGISSPNWLMMMLYRDFKKTGKLMFRTMVSLDILTEGGSGYPNLFQSGETWNGKLITNRQHPHDLVSELSMGYSRSIGKNAGVFAYLAYPGEPALGPAAYLHRASCKENPKSPLGHHWLDSTHVTFGVMSFGFWLNPFKLDASIFNGLEPDENRYNFDKPEFNSYSMRLTVNPIKETSMQISYGYIKDGDRPGQEDKMSKVTASIIYSIPVYDYIDWDYVNWNITSAWGLNLHDENPANSFLFESDFQINGNSFYARLESVEKTPAELDIVNNDMEHKLYPVTAVTLGYAREVLDILEYAYSGVAFSVGAQATWHGFGKDLKPVYGDSPVSAEVYIKISPKLMKMEGH